MRFCSRGRDVIRLSAPRSALPPGSSSAASTDRNLLHTCGWHSRSFCLRSRSLHGRRLALVVIAVLGLLKWDRFAVVMRAATQQVRVLDYVAAAEAAGASTLRVIVGEVLPNLLPQLVVVATVEAASAILLEAALSFLGLGVQPPLPSWGLMIAEGKDYMFFSFWVIAIPGTRWRSGVCVIWSATVFVTSRRRGERLSGCSARAKV